MDQTINEKSPGRNNIGAICEACTILLETVGKFMCVNSAKFGLSQKYPPNPYEHGRGTNRLETIAGHRPYSDPPTKAERKLVYHFFKSYPSTRSWVNYQCVFPDEGVFIDAMQPEEIIALDQMPQEVF